MRSGVEAGVGDPSMRSRWVSVTGVVLLATLAILATLFAGIRVMGY